MLAQSNHSYVLVLAFAGHDLTNATKQQATTCLTAPRTACDFVVSTTPDVEGCNQFKAARPESARVSQTQADLTKATTQHDLAETVKEEGGFGFGDVHDDSTVAEAVAEKKVDPEEEGGYGFGDFTVTEAALEEKVDSKEEGGYGFGDDADGDGDGVAAKDAGFKASMSILTVNGVDVRGSTHAEAGAQLVAADVLEEKSASTSRQVPSRLHHYAGHMMWQSLHTAQRM